MFIDTHLHLSDEYYDDIEVIVNNAKKSKVDYLIVSCCTMNEIKKGMRLIDSFDNIYITIGLHPSEVNNYSDEDIIKIFELITKNRKRIIGIGEIGLDYHYGKNDMDIQKELFIKQLNLAHKLNIPVVIHTRDAVEDTLSILKKFNLKGVIHCFSGSVEVAKEYIKLGYKLGIGGVLTFKNSRLSDVLKSIGISNIVLETDSPYLAPEPYRGQKNEPKNIPIIAEKIALLLNESIESVSKNTLKNTNDVFDLNIQL